MRRAGHSAARVAGGRPSALCLLALLFTAAALDLLARGADASRSRDAVATCSSLRSFAFHGPVVLPVSSSAWLDLGHEHLDLHFLCALPSALTEPASSADGMVFVCLYFLSTMWVCVCVWSGVMC